MPESEKVTCRTPTPGKSPWRIDKWKYDLIRSAILKIVPRTGSGIVFMELPGLVAKQLSSAERKKLGSVSWYTTTVKLDMKVKGELQRVADSKPQRLLKT